MQSPSRELRLQSQLLMTETAVVLEPSQRTLIEDTVQENCEHRGWERLAVNARTNHVHVVVAADVAEIEIPRELFKAWCTRRLKKGNPIRLNWWTDRGWDVWIDTEQQLSNVLEYVQEGQ
jgi:REP element-mobilizing transposase RayT